MPDIIQTIETDIDAVFNEIKTGLLDATGVLKEGAAEAVALGKSLITAIEPEVTAALSNAFDEVVKDLEGDALAAAAGDPVGNIGDQVLNAVGNQKPALLAKITPQIMNAVMTAKALSVTVASAAAGAAVTAVAGPVAGAAAAVTAGEAVTALEK